MRKKGIKANMVKVCALYSRTKQGYYKHRSYRLKQAKLKKEILPKVYQIRAEQPHVGTRKLKVYLERDGINVGRDKLFSILDENNLLSTVYRRKCITSKGKRSKYPNLIKKLGKAQRVGEIIASDITYLSTRKGFVFLSLTSDHYSDAVLGYSLQKNLSSEGPKQALKRAVKSLGNIKPGIHHSDHGSQYTSNEFLKLLDDNRFLPSMTGVGKCYDNAKAERINGILKHELNLKKVFKDYNDALLYVKEAINIYNNKRLIGSKEYQTPADLMTNLSIVDHFRSEKNYPLSTPLRALHLSSCSRGVDSG
jgi:putative transposase